MRTKFAALAAGAAGLLLLTGCGAHVPASDIEDDIRAEYEAIGYEAEVECPEDLPAEEGAQLQCDVHYEGFDVVVEVTAENVEGNEVEYFIEELPLEE